MVFRKEFLYFILAPTMVFTIAGLFAQIMIFFDHNEHMYVTAGVLVSQGKSLYKDFAYLQTPYLPLFYGLVYKLFHVQSYYLLIAKIISFSFYIGSAFILFCISKRFTEDRVISASVVCLFLLNGILLRGAVEASNYIAPVFFSFLGFYCFIFSFENQNVNKIKLFFAGLFCSLSIGLKLTYAVIFFPFLAVLFFQNHQLTNISAKTKWLSYGSFIAGFTVGILPLLLYFFDDYKIFIFNNFGYHTVNKNWRMLTNYSQPLSLFSKIVFILKKFFLENTILIISLIFINFVFFLKKEGGYKSKKTLSLFLSFLLFVFSFLSAFVPTPMFKQYLVFPISCLFLLFVSMYDKEALRVSLLNKKAVFILALISFFWSFQPMSKSIFSLFERHNWQGLRIHDISIEVKKQLESRFFLKSGPIASLSPLFLVESNLPIYPEFSTGPFLYRIGDFLTEEERKLYKGASPKSLSTFFQQSPPLALLTGFEMEKGRELLFVEYATEHGYEEIKVSLSEGRLFIKKIF